MLSFILVLNSAYESVEGDENGSSSQVDSDDVSVHNESDEAEIEDSVLDTSTIKNMKTNFYKLTKTEQENFSQEEMNIRFLLKLNPTRVYTLEDLNETETLDRGLRLLFHARYGQTKQHMKISPHVEYDKLPREVARQIAIKMSIEDREIKESKALLQFVR